MSKYLSVEEFISRFDSRELIMLTNLNDHGDATTIDTDLIDQKITEAESLIDSYMNATTLAALIGASTIPVVLKGHATNIVRYLLDYARPREDVRLRYEDSLQWLRLLARGEVSLGVDTGGSAIESSTVAVGSTGAPTPVFTREGLSGFNVEAYR